MLRCAIFLTAVIFLCSCAKPPHEEFRAAEYMVGKAYALQASEFAPAEYQAARTALTDAHRSMEETDYSDARDSIEFALKHARRAVVLSKELQAKRDEDEAQRALLEEQARQAAAAKTLAAEAARQAQASKPTIKPKPKPKPKQKAKPATSYIVGDGENLWTISAQPQVYNEGLLWPLLYQANRDQIKDPRQIFPGQTLGIRRDMTKEELEEARQKARESDIFPVPETVPAKQ